MRALFNFIIKFFGGYTEDDLKRHDEIVDSWRSRALHAEEKLESLESEISIKDAKIDQLIELVIISKNVTTPLPKEEVELSDAAPIQMNRMSWPRLKSKLERQHAIKKSSLSGEPDVEEMLSKINPNEVKGA